MSFYMRILNRTEKNRRFLFLAAVDDSTMNVLFAIEKDGEELLLPAHEEFIIKLDKKKRLLTVEVPDGLI